MRLTRVPPRCDMWCSLCGRAFYLPFVYAQAIRHREAAHGEPALRDRQN